MFSRVTRLISIRDVIFYANERSISGQFANVDFRHSYRSHRLAFSLLPRCERSMGHRHVRDTFGRCNSISSAVGLNNNTLKDCLYNRRVLYRARDDFYVIFFLPISHRRDGHIESRIDGPCWSRQNTISKFRTNILLFFLRGRGGGGGGEHETFSTAREINIFVVFAI